MRGEWRLPMHLGESGDIVVDARIWIIAKHGAISRKIKFAQVGHCFEPEGSVHRFGGEDRRVFAGVSGLLD